MHNWLDDMGGLDANNLSEKSMLTIRGALIYVRLIWLTYPYFFLAVSFMFFSLMALSLEFSFSSSHPG